MQGQALANRAILPGVAGIHEPDLVTALVAQLYGVPMEELRAGTRRGARAAFARQLAMYLTHVVYRHSVTRVAREFGRDRSTALHAFRRVEDLRDDPEFDRRLTDLENVLRDVGRIGVAA